MRGLFSVAQTHWTSVFFQVPWSVTKFSKSTLPANARVSTKRKTMDNTKKLRKGTSWSSRLDKRTNNLITHNIAGCGDLTAMVTY